MLTIGAVDLLVNERKDMTTGLLLKARSHFEPTRWHMVRNGILSLLSFAVSVLVSAAQGQDLQAGGVQGAEMILLSPDKRLNEEIKLKDIRTISQYGFDDRGGRIAFNPKVPATWRWLAAFNVWTKGERRSFFLYDGWLFTTVNVISGCRRQLCESDVSHFIRSNVYHAAFHRKKAVENEIVVLLVSPKKQRVSVELDSTFFGHHKVLEFDMNELEAKFISVSILPEEFTVVAWAPEIVPRRSIALNNNWYFRKGDVSGAEKPSFDHSNWQSVSIPHTWNDRDVYDVRNIRDGLDIMEMYYRGPGWYRKVFVPEASLKGLNLKLHFLGANQVTDVWLNGICLGRHIGGYLGFQFDVTTVLRLGKKNVLAVRVDNAYNYDIPPHTADFDFYGGLYREVELIAASPVRIEDVLVRTPTVSRAVATVSAKSDIRNSTRQEKQLTLVANIVSPYNEIVQSVASQVLVPAGNTISVDQKLPPIKNPLLWSPDRPWLYKVYSTIYDEKGTAVDQTISPLGFRWFAFDADSGFFLNGRSLKLKGVNIHQDFLNKGNAVGIDQKRADLTNVKMMGANFVRLAHYPHHPAVLDLADSLGLLVWEEIPFLNTVGREEFFKNTKQMLVDMIARDKNHPSIILWGLGNEFTMTWLAEDDTRFAKQLTQDLHSLVKQLDPTRLTVQAHNEVSDTTILGITDVQGRNRYYGWYEGTYTDLGPALDREKKMFPHWKVLVSEYGAEAKYGYHVDDPTIFDHSETYQMLFHEASWQAINNRPWVAGGAIWNMYDFGSFRKIGNIPHINQKGMMTKDRKPKGVYYYYQSQWSSKPMVYIVSHTWTHRKGVEGVPQSVRVFSNCDSVEFFLNGNTLGKQEHGFVWKTHLTNGENTLRAIGYSKGETVRDEMMLFFDAIRADKH